MSSVASRKLSQSGSSSTKSRRPQGFERNTVSRSFPEFMPWILDMQCADSLIRWALFAKIRLFHATNYYLGYILIDTVHAQCISPTFLSDFCSRLHLNMTSLPEWIGWKTINGQPNTQFTNTQRQISNQWISCSITPIDHLTRANSSIPSRLQISKSYSKYHLSQKEFGEKHTCYCVGICLPHVICVLNMFIDIPGMRFLKLFLTSVLDSVPVIFACSPSFPTKANRLSSPQWGHHLPQTRASFGHDFVHQEPALQKWLCQEMKRLFRFDATTILNRG
jgi:hypothetical protein